MKNQAPQANETRRTRAAYTRVARLALCLTALGCGSEAEPPKLAGDDEILAHVNGSAITRYDVDRASRDVLGRGAATALDDDARKRVLQSVVQSRAIAHARDKELTPVERVELERKVAAYREELLVKQYLVRHTPPGGVSNDMVRAYYESNKERFGAAHVRSYELLTASVAAAGAQRDALLQALGKAAQEKDWQAWTVGLNKAGLAVSLRHGRDDEAVLHPKLAQLLAHLPVGQTSALTLVEGNAYLARVTAQTEQPAKPLREVSDEIRRTLAPVKLKEAVKQASDQVLKNAEVAYR